MWTFSALNMTEHMIRFRENVDFVVNKVLVTQYGLLQENV